MKPRLSSAVEIALPLALAAGSVNCGAPQIEDVVQNGWETLVTRYHTHLTGDMARCVADHQVDIINTSAPTVMAANGTKSLPGAEGIVKHNAANYAEQEGLVRPSHATAIQTMYGVGEVACATADAAAASCNDPKYGELNRGDYANIAVMTAARAALAKYAETNADRGPEQVVVIPIPPYALVKREEVKNDIYCVLVTHKGNQ